jgi:MGT family glycosyltransferase
MMGVCTETVRTESASPVQSLRVLFAPASNVLAHTGRCLVLARALQARGHHAVFVGTKKLLANSAIVTPGEIEFHELDDYGAQEGLAFLRSLVARPDYGFMDSLVEQELALLDHVKPDVIVVDFRVSMFVSARVKCIPVVSLLGGRWLLENQVQPLHAPRTHPAYPWLRGLLGEGLTNRIVVPLQLRALRYKVRPIVRLQKKYGVALKRDLWKIIEGEHNLILDTDRAAPTTPLPSDFERVGPIVWSPASETPDWFADLDPERPLVYITLGSTGHPDLFAKLIRAFADEAFTVILTTGGQIDFDPVDVPSNFHVADYIPGEAVMNRADVVVFHGGAGTGYQLMGTGTPGVVVATHLEQEFMGELLEDEGAGVFLTMREVLARPERAVTTVKRILADAERFRANMSALQDDLARYRPVEAAVTSVEQFAADRLATHE